MRQQIGAPGRPGQCAVALEIGPGGVGAGRPRRGWELGQGLGEQLTLVLLGAQLGCGNGCPQVMIGGAPLLY